MSQRWGQVGSAFLPPAQEEEVGSRFGPPTAQEGWEAAVADWGYPSTFRAREPPRGAGPMSPPSLASHGSPWVSPQPGVQGAAGSKVTHLSLDLHWDSLYPHQAMSSAQDRESEASGSTPCLTILLPSRAPQSSTRSPCTHPHSLLPCLQSRPPGPV